MPPNAVAVARPVHKVVLGRHSSSAGKEHVLEQAVLAVLVRVRDADELLQLLVLVSLDALYKAVAVEVLGKDLHLLVGELELAHAVGAAEFVLLW